jgi:3-oxoadipate enol-lactonase
LGPVRETGGVGRRCEISTVELSYLEDGPADAPVVLLMHPIGGAAELWEPQVPALAGPLRVIRVDARGHGRSPAPPGPYDLADLGGDTIALIDRLGVERVHLAGESLGGMVGMWLAQHAPDRLDRLALMCTSALLGPPRMWVERAETALAKGTEALADGAIGRWFTESFRAREPELVGRIRAMIAATSPVGYAGCCAAIQTMDQRAGLPSITTPTLVIAGADDPSTTPDQLRLIADNIPGSRYVELADCAHIANVQQADKINELLLAHFTG